MKIMCSVQFEHVPNQNIQKMGVPAFFRWLQKQYPLIISNCIEVRDTFGHYSEETTTQNPNTLGDRDFDCLYLDMNGLIHPCFHPEGNKPPRSEAEIFSNIEKYVLRLFNIVRPKRVLYMAIDGPAPRAKMNQQRMRRFRAAKDSAYNRWVKLWKAHDEGDQDTYNLLVQKDYQETHDSNVITPGTPFFQRLSEHLKGFIKRMQETDPLWKQIYVILSDASVPGEGEHKIMDFVRAQRLEPNYDPNTRHVIYGLDADLIFLGLASHEPYFTIMRENVLETKEKSQKKPEEQHPDQSTEDDHYVPPPTTTSMINDSEQDEDSDLIGPKQFHFVSLWVLRQYLERDLHPPNIPPHLPWNLDYAIDDFVFLCYTCGNDFLPGLPGFSIYTGTIQAIVSLYREKLPQFGAYITRNGEIDFPRFIDFIRAVNDPRGNGQYFHEKRALLQIICPSKKSQEIEEAVNQITTQPDPDINSPPPKKSMEEPKPMDPAERRKKNQIVPRTIDGIKYDDTTSLQEIKKQYYKMKFGITNEDGVRKVVYEYAKGMKWVLNYYLHGPHYWSWYYPYHSAPCSSDWLLLDTDYSHYTFPPGQPYLPLWQLLCVLPPQSAHALPEAMQFYMKDQKSPLIDLYPTTFQVDMEGGTQSYKGHVLVPFIDEERIIKIMNDNNIRLSKEEEQRNKFGQTLIFISEHDIVTPQNTVITIHLPPITKENPVTYLQGPIWGQLQWCPHSDDDSSPSHCYIYNIRNIAPNQDMTWIRPGIQFPPWAIEKVSMGNDQDVFWDKGAVDLEVEYERRLMPLQLPGVIPGAPYNYRENLITRIEDQAKLRGLR